MTLELGDAAGTPADVKDLLIKLDYGYGETIDKQMALDLGEGLADLAGLSSNNSFQVTYGVDAGLHLAIPLATTFDPNGLRVLDTTGVCGASGRRCRRPWRCRPTSAP